MFRETSSWVLAVKRNRNIALLKGMFYFLYCPFIPCVLVVQQIISRLTSKKELRKLRKERKMKQLARELEEEENEESSDSEKEIPHKISGQLEQLEYGLSDEYSRSEIETSDEVSLYQCAFLTNLLFQHVSSSHLTSMSCWIISIQFSSIFIKWTAKIFTQASRYS